MTSDPRRREKGRGSTVVLRTLKMSSSELQNSGGWFCRGADTENGWKRPKQKKMLKDAAALFTSRKATTASLQQARVVFFSFSFSSRHGTSQFFGFG